MNETSRELVRVGFERDGSLCCLSLRSAEGVGVTFTANVAFMSSLAATLTMGVQPDTSEGYELAARAALTVQVKS